MLEPNAFAATATSVVRKISVCPGCERRSDLDTSHAHCFAYTDPLSDQRRATLFFIPVPENLAGFTQAQLDEIERTLAAFGIDLFPLDPYILN